MSKTILLALLLSVTGVAHAVPSNRGPAHPARLFTTAELNNLARLDEDAPPARVRRLQTEIADLRDQVGRMKLERLIDTVLTADRRRPAAR